MTNTLPINNRDLVFYRRLRRNLVFSEVLAYFAKAAEKNGLTKQQIAKLLDKQPSQITRWFSEPANLCLDTISDLLVAMDAEMEFRVVPSDRSYSYDELMEDFEEWAENGPDSSPFSESASSSVRTNNPARISIRFGETGEQSSATA